MGNFEIKWDDYRIAVNIDPGGVPLHRQPLTAYPCQHIRFDCMDIEVGRMTIIGNADMCLCRGNGAAYVTRTRDPVITNDVLYQLS